MTIEDLGNLGELIAAIATLVTIVYLAAQVGQAKRQLHESTRQARSAFTVDIGKWAAEIQLRWFSAAGPNPAMMKALLTDEHLSSEEGYEFAVQMSIFFGALMQSEQLQRRGLLDEEFTPLARSIYMPYLAMPRVRRWWKNVGSTFYAHDEAGRFVDRMVEEIEEREASDTA